MKKIGLIFGGRSAEHEISILSAASLMDALDASKYEVIPVGINRKGDWFRIHRDMSCLRSLDDARMKNLIPEDSAATAHAEVLDMGIFADLTDFAFPVLHGPYGEDGTIQGFFEMLGKPYAGCGVTSCALSMDKIFTKDVWARAGLPIGRYIGISATDFQADAAREMARIEAAVPYPFFVKPANMGSSVGVSKVDDRQDLAAAIQKARPYDHRIIIEESTLGRELEIAMLGNETPEASVIGEIIIESEFYDYDAKYRSNTTRLCIPAELPAEAAAKIASLAVEAYHVLDGAGYARIDCFYDEKTGNIYLNEMNAIPGFTVHSMFPLLWEASGRTYPDLAERIIELGYERHHLKNNR